MRILALSRQADSNIAAIRLGQPLQQLVAKAQAELRLASFHQWTQTDLRWADVVIFQRPSNTRMLNAMRRVKVMGKPIIVEIDDLLTQTPAFLQNHKLMLERRGLLETMLGMADAVSTTTSDLAGQLIEFNPEVHLVPNYAPDPPSAMADHRAGLSRCVTLVIASSDTVQVDFLIPAIRNVHARYGSSVEVVCIGAIARAIDIPGLVTYRHPIVSRRRFVELVASLPGPIGLIPLDDSVFSACKSAIKYFDYSVCGAPTICSDVNPYREVIRDKETGLLVANDSTHWHQAICTLIDNPVLRARLACQAALHVRQHHHLTHTVQAWQQVLTQVCSQGRQRLQLTRLQAAQDAWLNMVDRINVFLRELNQARQRRRKAGTPDF